MTKRIGLLVAAGLLVVLLGGCSLINQSVAPTTEVPAVEKDSVTPATVSSEVESDQTVDNSLPDENQGKQAAEPASNVFSGLIKEYAEGGVNDFFYYVEFASGTKQGIKVCDDRVANLNDAVAALAGSDVAVDLYSKSSQTGGACINGLVAKLGNEQVKYSGLIKKYADGGYGDISHYIQMTDGTKFGVKVCDKRVSDVWEQLVAVSDSVLPVDLYVALIPNVGACVTGIVVNY